MPPPLIIKGRGRDEEEEENKVEVEKREMRRKWMMIDFLIFLN